MDGDESGRAGTRTLGAGPAEPDALRQAQPFIRQFVSADRRVLNLADELYSERIAGKGVPRLLRIREHVVCVLLNLYSAHLNHHARYVRYSRDPGRYNKSRYNPLPITWRKLNRVVTTFAVGDLIEHHNGIPGFDGFDNGKQARMRATSKLMEMMVKEYEFTPDVIAREPEEVIVLRGPKDDQDRAEDITYRDTVATRRMRSNLEEINHLLSKTWIDIFLSDDELHRLNLRMGRRKDRVPIDFRRNRLKRIFNNGTFKNGGRFYHGWWQEVPSEYRQFIAINGKPTVEVDYSGMHFVMFYSDVGHIGAPQDPYALPGIDRSDRKMVKKALNAMINASSEDETLKAIRSEAQEMQLPKAYPTAEKLVAALREMHAPIQNVFCTGEGLRAQHLDSKIAEKIMLTFSKWQVPVLPVHDSFIIATDEVEQLKREMTRIFEVIVQRARGAHSVHSGVGTCERAARREAESDSRRAGRVQPLLQSCAALAPERPVPTGRPRNMGRHGQEEAVPESEGRQVTKRTLVR